jgi:hypothetical protein
MELPEQDEADLFAYVLADYSDTKCPRACMDRIPDIIKRANQRLSGVTVYRGHTKFKKTIEFTVGRKNFMSTSLARRAAVNFTDFAPQSSFATVDPLVQCCLFTIHLDNALAIDISKVSFERALTRKLDHLIAVNPNPFPTDRVERFNHHLRNEAEVIVLGGGTFYQDAEKKTPGFALLPVPEDQVARRKRAIEMHRMFDDHGNSGLYETWYTTPAAAAGRRTRRRRHRTTKNK